jgi:hypothetical protein
MKMRWSHVWSHLVWSEHGELLPFAHRSSLPLDDPPFDREAYPELARAMDDWLDGSCSERADDDSGFASAPGKRLAVEPKSREVPKEFPPRHNR